MQIVDANKQSTPEKENPEKERRTYGYELDYTPIGFVNVNSSDSGKPHERNVRNISVRRVFSS